MITNESISVDASEQSFFTVHYVRLDDGIDMSGRLCFERKNLYLVTELLKGYLSIRGFPEVACHGGNDNFRFYESGSDQQSFINILNRRPDGVPESRLSGLMLTGSATGILLTELLNNSKSGVYYPPYDNCRICSNLKDFQRGDQKIGKEAEDTFLPPAADELKTIKTVTRRREVKRCPECATFYLYETEYDFLIGGSEDTQRLTRLTIEETASYL